MTSTPSRNWLRRLVAGAAGTALAAGLAVATAPPADAAPGVWDRVAACESGGNWQINTGNGYYGGLQFSVSTWRGFGGTRYAAYPHQASKAQQIAIAQRTLATQGPGAWPVCSRRAGLTKANGGANATAASASAAPAARRAAPSRSTTRPTARWVAPKRAATHTITVRSGDTLSKLARKHNVAGGWQALAKINRLKNPNLIFVGQHIRLA